MPVLGETGIAMLQNCQAAHDYLNDWEHGFIESISLKSRDDRVVEISDKQIWALQRIWKKLPAYLQNLQWRENHRDIPDLRRHEELDNDDPF